MPEDPELSGCGQQQPRVVRPPADSPAQGKDDVEYGWGEDDDVRRPTAADEEFLRRHRADRPPHHDSDWG